MQPLSKTHTLLGWPPRVDFRVRLPGIGISASERVLTTQCPSFRFYNGDLYQESSDPVKTTLNCYVGDISDVFRANDASITTAQTNIERALAASPVSKGLRASSTACIAGATVGALFLLAQGLAAAIVIGSCAFVISFVFATYLIIAQGRKMRRDLEALDVLDYLNRQAHRLRPQKTTESALAQARIDAVDVLIAIDLPPGLRLATRQFADCLARRRDALEQVPLCVASGNPRAQAGFS